MSLQDLKSHNNLKNIYHRVHREIIVIVLKKHREHGDNEGT